MSPPSRNTLDGRLISVTALISVAMIEADTAYHGSLRPPRKKSRIVEGLPAVARPIQCVSANSARTTAQSIQPNEPASDPAAPASTLDSATRAPFLQGARRCAERGRFLEPRRPHELAPLLADAAVRRNQRVQPGAAQDSVELALEGRAHAARSPRVVEHPA